VGAACGFDVLLWHVVADCGLHVSIARVASDTAQFLAVVLFCMLESWMKNHVNMT